MSWSKLNIKTFIEVNKAMNGEYESEEAKTFAILSALHNKPVEYFENIPIVKLRKYISDAKFLFSKEYNKKRLSKVLKVNGKKYNVNLKVSELRGGEYRDLSTLCKDVDSINDNYHLIFSIFLSKRDWLGRDLFKRWINNAKTKDELVVVYSKITQERMKIAEVLKQHLTMDYVFTYSGFFLKLSQRLTNATNRYLMMEAKMQQRKAKSLLLKAVNKDLQNIGGGL